MYVMMVNPLMIRPEKALMMSYIITVMRLYEVLFYAGEIVVFNQCNLRIHKS